MSSKDKKDGKIISFPEKTKLLKLEYIENQLKRKQNELKEILDRAKTRIKKNRGT
jgi:hypothetical protein